MTTEENPSSDEAKSPSSIRRSDFEALQRQISSLREENEDLRSGQSVKNGGVANMIALLAFVSILFLGNTALNGFLAYEIASTQTASFRDSAEDQKRTMELSVESARDIVPAMANITSDFINSFERRLEGLEASLENKINQNLESQISEIQEKIGSLDSSLELLYTEVSAISGAPEVEVVSKPTELQFDRRGVTSSGVNFCNAIVEIDFINRSSFSIVSEKYQVYTGDLYFWVESNKRPLFGELRRFSAVENRTHSISILPGRSERVILVKGIGVDAAKAWASSDEKQEPANFLYSVLFESKSGSEAVVEIDLMVRPVPGLAKCLEELSNL